ncbi:MAG TPA: hypothetical protein VJ964_15080 [Balneolaceae bacterium]|nr:hypothetical protein [Balneolaceae bacterium]
MIKKLLPVLIILLVACHKKQTPNDTSNPQRVSVLTQHNNNSRSGWNNQETLLTTDNVNPKQFGKLFTLPVDDQIYAQPLVVGNLFINNSLHNVVYAATVNNSVYAYDGDTGELYWKKNFTASGMRPPKNSDMTGACGGNYHDFSGNMGIVGTPVIDKSSKTIYFVARSMSGNSFVQYLHAVNIVNGDEVAGSPVKITASIEGNGTGSSNGVITFDAQKQNQRQALTLVDGTVYVTFSSHCDWGPYHGWILGYNTSTLQQQIVYNDTPNGFAGGIWESGGGMAADGQGNLYVVAGNGTVGDNGDQTNLTNRGESAMKLSPSGSTLQVETFFTPYDYLNLNNYDLDYGSMGAFLIPNSDFYFTGGKSGNMYLLNKDMMGGYQSSSNQVQQTVQLSSEAKMHCQPAYFKDNGKEFVYVWTENEPLRAYPFDRNANMLDESNQIISKVSGPSGESGAVLSVSSNGSEAGTGILWASYASSGNAEHEVSPGILRAFDAGNVTKELWNNHQNFDRDGAGNYAKFSSPTIANGHVYLPTFSDRVVVYGLLD